MEFKAYIKLKQELVNNYLEQCLPAADHYPPTIHQAMRYSVFAGGKRLRAILALASAYAVGGEPETILPIAAALELIRAYSLVHDYLPAMDNDDLRRGKPTNHKVYGEAIAVLAGDALLTLAFELLTSPALTTVIAPEQQLNIIRRLSQAAGSMGLIGGQVVDIESEGKQVDVPQLEYIHTHKTGTLIRASVMLGGLAANCSEKQLALLCDYGEKVGLAYQIIDDILDVEGESETLGKHTGADANAGKVTYPAVWGMKQAKSQARHLIAAARQDLEPLGEKSSRLKEIAQFIGRRKS